MSQDTFSNECSSEQKVKMHKYLFMKVKTIVLKILD